MRASSTNLIIDCGNSSAKVGIFHDRECVEKLVFASIDELKFFLENFSAQHCIVSSVTIDAASILSWTKQVPHQFVLSATLPLPIKNLYGTPETLGADRIAGVCGAHEIFPAAPCLVIDAGTCITYDFIDQQGSFLGGSISPGLRMRFNAMHTFTAKLPLVEPVDFPELIGSNTETCMQSGVVNGLVAELQGIIQQYDDKFPDLKIILSGGDARFFENKLKGSIFAVPELVLGGLNSILLHNVSI